MKEPIPSSTKNVQECENRNQSRIDEIKDLLADSNKAVMVQLDISNKNDNIINENVNQSRDTLMNKMDEMQQDLNILPVNHC
jgi:hypothetical protein